MHANRYINKTDILKNCIVQQYIFCTVCTNKTVKRDKCINKTNKCTNNIIEKDRHINVTKLNSI